MNRIYSTSPNGAIYISPAGIKNFIEDLGYVKHYMSEDKTSKPIYLKKNGKLLEPVIPLRVHEAGIGELETRTDGPYSLPYKDRVRVLDKLIASKYITSGEMLITLSELDKPILTDTADKAYFPFRNGIVTVTGSGITFDPLDTINGYIWASDVTDRDFAPVSFHEATQSDYYRFLCNISASKTSDKWIYCPGRFEYLYSLIGYLLHSFKDPTNPRAVIIMDASLIGDPAGRRGKGIYVFAIFQIRNGVNIDGKSFYERDRFKYSCVTPSTRLLYLDDVPQDFKFETFFSVITEGIKVEEKFVTSYYIPYDKSPKIIISTNYAITGTGSSHNARRYEYALSDYYSDAHAPIDDFGKRFFDDWNTTEWNYFDNLMLYAVQYYLQNGVSVASDPKIEEKKLLTETSPEFVEWVHDQGFETGERYESSVIYERYIRDTESTADRKTFAGYLRSFAHSNGWVLILPHSGNVRYMEFKSR